MDDFWRKQVLFRMAVARETVVTPVVTKQWFKNMLALVGVQSHPLHRPKLENKQ